jgi:hypothetical protein
MHTERTLRLLAASIIFGAGGSWSVELVAGSMCGKDGVTGLVAMDTAWNCTGAGGPFSAGVRGGCMFTPEAILGVKGCRVSEEFSIAPES